MKGQTMAKASGATKKKGGGGKVVPIAGAKTVKKHGKQGHNGAEAKPGELALQTVGQKDEEAFKRWFARLRKANDTVLAAMKIVQNARGELGGLFGSAKEAGIPTHRLSVVKKLFKEEQRDPAEVVADAREMAWQVKVTGSKLGQLGLFSMTEPAPEAYEELGYQAGLKGEPIDNAPGRPGEERYANWSNGWKRGHKENSDKVFDVTGQDAAEDGGKSTIQ